MVELAIRILMAGIATLAVAFGSPANLDFTWKASLFWVTLGIFHGLLERRGLRQAHTNTAMILADATFACLVLSKVGMLSTWGGACTLSAVIMSRKGGFQTMIAAPLASGILLALSQINGSPLLSKPLALQVGAAVMILALASGLTTKAPAEEDLMEAELPSKPEPLHEPEFLTNEPEPEPEPEPDLIHQLRSKLRDAEGKLRASKLANRLLDTGNGEMVENAAALTKLIQETFDCRGIALYTTTLGGSELVVRATAGDLPYRVKVERLNLSSINSDVRLRTYALALLKDPEDDSPAAAVLLKHRGKLVGLLWMTDTRKADLDESRDQAEECAELLGSWVNHLQHQSMLQERLTELSLLVEMGRVEQGSDTPRTLFARVVNELWCRFDLDHLGISLVIDGEYMGVTNKGAQIKFMDLLPSWINQPTNVLIRDTHESPEIPVQEAIKRRIGSVSAIPIFLNGELTAVLTAASHRKSGIQPETHAKLESIANELSLATARLEGLSVGGGLVLAEELQRAMTTNSGSLVVFEPLNRAELLAIADIDDLQEAFKLLARRIRPTAPSHAYFCSREQDLLVFIPGQETEKVREWANDAVAQCLLHRILIKTSEGRTALTIQAKSSPIGATNHGEIASYA